MGVAGVAGKTSGRGGVGHQYLLNVKNVSIQSSGAPEVSYIETLHWSHLGVLGRKQEWALSSAELASLKLRKYCLDPFLFYPV